MNPRPAGYESASDSTETYETVAVYGPSDSSVAPKVALKTPENARKPLISNGELETLIELLPADLARLIRVWPSLPEILQQSILSIIDNATNSE